MEARLAPSASLLERLQKEETARAVPPEAPADFYALAGAVRCHGAALADALPPSVGWCPPGERVRVGRSTSGRVETATKRSFARLAHRTLALLLAER